MALEALNLQIIPMSAEERRAPVPTLGTMPKGVADLLWQNLAPAEADQARRACRGTLASEQSTEAQIRIGFRYEIDLLFTWMEDNFQTDLSDCKQRIEFLISDLTLPAEKKIREKIHAELVLLFYSLSDEDLAKTDTIDALPLRRLRGEMLSSIWMVTSVREQRVNFPAPFSGVFGLMSICTLLNKQKRFDEAIEIANTLPSMYKDMALSEVCRELVAQGYLAKATRLVHKIAMDSLKAEPLACICLAYAAQRRFDQAIPILDMLPDSCYSKSIVLVGIQRNVKRACEDFIEKNNLIEALQLINTLPDELREQLRENIIDILIKHKFFDEAIAVAETLKVVPLSVGDWAPRSIALSKIGIGLCAARLFATAKIVAGKIPDANAKEIAKKYIFSKQHPVLNWLLRVIYSFGLLLRYGPTTAKTLWKHSYYNITESYYDWCLQRK